MSNNIRGITVELGGNTGPLNSALKDSNKAAYDLQSELREVNKQLKFDPKNTELLTQKQKLLAGSTEALKQKQAVLKEAVEQAHAQFDKGDLGADKVRAVEREYQKVTSQLKDLAKEAGITNASLNKISTVTGNIGSAAETAGKKMLPVTGIILGAGAAAGKMGSDFVESENKVDVAFGKAADQVKAFSKTSLEQFGVASGTALDMGATFGDMATSMGLPQKAAANMSTSLVGLAGDLSSFKNINLDESATALNSIFTGETESLKKLGIVMTENNLSAFALSEGIKKPMKSMTEAEKVQLRYNYVMNATKNAHGDFARTADGAANSTRVATESFKEAGESVGVMLTPIIAKAAQYVSSLVKSFSGLDAGTKQIILVILGIVAAVAPTLIIAGRIFNLVSAVTGAMAMLKTATFAQTVAQFGLNAALLASPITWIVVGVLALVAVFAVLWVKCEGFRNFWIGLWNAIKAAAQAVANWFTGDFVNFFKNAWAGIQGAFSNVGSWFTSTFQGAKDGIQNAWSNAGNWFSGVGEKIKSGFNATISWVKDNWKSLALFIVNPIAGAASLLYNNNPAFKKWADDTMKTVKEGFTNGWNSVMNFFSTVGNGIANFFSPFLNNLKSIFLEIWKPIQEGLSQAWNGIKMAATAAWEMIKNVVLAPVLLLIDLVTLDFGKMKSDMDHIWINIQNAAKSFWTGLQMFFAGIGNAIVGAAKAYWEIVVNGFTNLWQRITTGAVNAWNGIILFFAQTWETIKTSTVNAWNGFWTVIFTALGSIKSGVINTWNSVIAWFQALPGTFWNIGSNMFLSMSKGVSSTVHTVSNSAKSGINTAIDWLKSLPGTLWNIGSNMFTSMRNGVTGTVHTVSDAVKSGIGAAIDWIKRIPSDALQWGKDIIYGIVNGIKSAANAVGDAVKGVAQNIRSFLHFSVPDEGPLKDFESWMPDFMEGLADTMTANIDKVRGAAQKVAQSMAAAIPTDISAGYKVDAAVAAAYGNYGAAGSGKASGSGNYGESQNSAPVFNQTVNNYSPEALTPSEVARQARNATKLLLLKQKG